MGREVKPSHNVAQGKKDADVLHNLADFLSKDLTSEKIKFLFVYFTVISLLEIFAYLSKGIWSITASRIWVLTGLICLGTIAVYFVKAVISDFLENKVFATVSITLLTFLLFYMIGNLNIADINPDAAQQAAAGMDSLKASDLNYTGKAFLGYANRQYLITALPAMLFGRSIFTLHLGFALPFIAGIYLLYAALRQWAQKLNLNTNIAVVPLFAFFVFPFVTEYYTNFEQAIYPISFCTLAVGFFLLLMIKPNVINILCTAWIGCLFSNSYTPSLAALGLLIVFLGLSAYLYWLKPGAMPFKIPGPVLAAKAFLLMEGNIIVFFIATLLTKRQDKVTEFRSEIKLISVAYKSIYEFLIDKYAAFLGMAGIIVILYLFASLTFRLKFYDFLLSLWVLGVFAVSFLLTGYTSYEPSWIMQRALIVIPVIIVGITLTIFHFLSRNQIKVGNGIPAVIAFTFVFIGISNFNKPNQSFIYFNYIQPMKYLWSDLEKTVKEKDLNAESEFNLVLYTGNALLKNPADYCKFFFPNATVYVPENEELPADMDFRKDTFIYGDNGIPQALPADTVRDVLQYNNKKHTVEGIWYKGSIIN